MVTLDAIQLKIARLEKQAAALADKQASLGLEKIRGLMQKHGLGLDDIERFLGKRRGRKPSAKAADGAARGRTASVAPKYADPKTGATWSGRGRAPAWIKDVKDRTRFLIGGNAAVKTNGAKTASNGKATVKRATKKTAHKATAAKKVAARPASAHKKAAPAKKVTASRKAAAPRKAAARKRVSAAAKVAGNEAVMS